MATAQGAANPTRLTRQSWPGGRPAIRGKHLFVAGEKLYVRGVTYGPFRADPETGEQYDLRAAERDLAAIAANGFNAIRTYTVPPRWLLDLAWRHGLRVMVGIPWEQHVAFLDEDRAASIEQRVRQAVRRCGGHPAVLCYAVGNEIPSPIVRWHGPRRVEGFLRSLYRAAKDEDPDALVTYVNYPSTEYLQLPFFDLVCFNVYLEHRQQLERYVARLQNIAGDRPLVLTELGLDSRRNGLQGQADALEWQARTAFAGGSAGAFVFAWTDEWHRAGRDIEDWDFGLTDRNRLPKPALAAVRDALAELPFAAGRVWPRISVVVCTYNGARTLGECLAGIARLEYPDYEVIVVSDGSTDSSAELAAAAGARVIETERRGLGLARNAGLAAAGGEIVAYLDDDATPDPHWLVHLADAFAATNHACIGGPNTPFPGDGRLASCVSHVPGGPIHVLVDDTEAEHVPGCNMAFRKERLDELGGFDSQFRTAGDDVDVCWRIRDRGWTIGFDPGAVVWHHRRGTLRGFWRQQTGYGAAEAALERKWPERYSLGGHVSWGGRMYTGGSSASAGRRRSRVHYGPWGAGLFQSIYAPADHGSRSLLRMPEWHLLIAFLAGLSTLGPLWSPLYAALPALVLAVAAYFGEAVLSAATAPFAGPPSPLGERLVLRALTALFFAVQPLARLNGRARAGLTPWRRRRPRDLAFPCRRTWRSWSERWRSPAARLESLEAALRARGLAVLRGGEFDRWDLEARPGTFGAVRIQLTVEEHGEGRQLERIRLSPRWAPETVLLAFGVAALAAGAAAAGSWIAAALLCVPAVALVARAVGDVALAAGAVRAVLEPRHLPASAPVRRRRRAEVERTQA